MANGCGWWAVVSWGMRLLGLGLVALVGVLGCRSGSVGLGAAKEEKTFALRGKIVATDEAGGTITVDGGAVPGFMDAMTMPYKVAAPETISEMHAGDLITATIVVDGKANGAYETTLDHVVVVGEARVNVVPKVQYHVPAAGDAIPDFHLLDQSGKVVHLQQFKGKVLLMTFIYTRCPLADFCPRMSENFAEIDRALSADPKAYKKTHLLSVSFDPAYDTPAVLRSYGGAHTGRFTEEQFQHWEFAAPSVADLPKVEQYFDVGVTGAGDPMTLMHSLSTILIGEDGKVIAWYPSKDWKVPELVGEMERAAR